MKMEIYATKKIVIMITMLFLLTVSCAQNADAVTQTQTSTPSTQKVLFEFWHENYAWGYRSEGFFINNEGEIISFHTMSENAKPDHDGLYTEEEIFHKYALNPANSEKIGQLELSELSAMSELIQPASQGELVEKTRKIIGSDIGSFYLIAYLYDEDNHSYKSVLLSHIPEYGPSVINNSIEARMILDRLEALEIDDEFLFLLFSRIFFFSEQELFE